MALLAHFWQGDKNRLKASGDVYRLGRKPDPWTLPDWASAGPDGTFGNRFDDPKSTYRVLYASSQRLGCYVETLARFRIDLSLITELQNVVGDNDFYPQATVPAEWLSARMMGTAAIEGEYVEICNSDWISRLRVQLAPLLIVLGIKEFDAATVQLTSVRHLTQHISRLVFDTGANGIHYPSKYGHDIQNWALFEPFQIKIKAIQPIRSDDPDLLKALNLHSLRLG